MYPAELETKDTTESNTSASYLDLLLSIESDGQLRTSLYEKRDEFNFHLTNFPFLGSNIPSSPAYGVLFHSSYGMPGLAHLMNVLFQGQSDFHLSSSDRDMSWNVWNRPSGNFMVDFGISSNIMQSPSPKCYMAFWDMTIYNNTLNWSDITPICELITELCFITDFDLTCITKFWRFPYNIATGAASQQRTLTPPATWSCPIWDLHLL